MFPVLIVSGPVGVGKTSVGNEVSNLLEADGVPHCWIDLDMLTHTFPRPEDDPFHCNLLRANLSSLWANAKAAGALNLVCARVIETPADAEAIRSAIDGAELHVCRLTASDATLIQRVRRREIGAGCEWHERRAVELARILESGAPSDFVLSAERPVGEIAREVFQRVRWRR